MAAFLSCCKQKCMLVGKQINSSFVPRHSCVRPCIVLVARNRKRIALGNPQTEISDFHTVEGYKSKPLTLPIKPSVPLLFVVSAESVGMQLMKSFSLYENVPKMMDVEPKPFQLRALDGIRFFSMTWIILSHVYSITASSGAFRKSYFDVNK